MEHIGKQYRLGEIGTGTLSHDLNRYFNKLRGRGDLNLKIGEKNDRTLKAVSDFVWALNDINFNVGQGDVIGLIGKNGAGKSTLLKILSQVTAPTTGQVKIKGRIASLLEVGTGFHPELTGRENVFLNGAILGMTKAEIKSKFEEIIAFSGVERYIDTPVKRYSSGMLVRLGFAVAAHLEAEILVVDEVLAVGDIEFQQKCLGKMNDVSKSGRTILFVSHNMQAISQLCTRGILIEKGEIAYDGASREAVKRYLTASIDVSGPSYNLLLNEDRKGSGEIRFERLEFYNNKEMSNTYVIGDTLIFRISYRLFENIKYANMAFHLFDEEENIISNIENVDSNFVLENLNASATIQINLSNLNLYPGVYKIGFWMGSPDGSVTYDHLLRCAEFSIVEGSPLVKRKLSRNGGWLYLQPTWQFVKSNE